MTVLAMHQPNFLPWTGFFHKMAQADVFVLMDTAQVPDGGSWANRAMIKTPTGPAWFTLPIKSGGRPSYKDQELAADSGWTHRMMKMLHCNYAKSSYCNAYSNCIEAILYAHTNGLACRDKRSLAMINAELIWWLAGVLGIDTTITTLSQEHNVYGYTKERLPIFLCEEFDADVYLSGTGARSYNKRALFKAAGIELRYQEFECPVYPQLWGDFLPNLSVIDLLFNCGLDAESILKGA